MTQNLIMTKTAPDPIGVSMINDQGDIRVSIDFGENRRCGIVLKCSANGKQQEIMFPDSLRTGNVISAIITGLPEKYDEYQLLTDSGNRPDARACGFRGFEKFGIDVRDFTVWSRLCMEDDFDWGDDRSPGINYEDAFIYLVHVRGYTMSPKSCVSAGRRGTFAGLMDKIPYLRSLGVTTLELMPVCEMNCVERIPVHHGSMRGHLPEGTSAVSDADEPPVIFSENGSLKDRREVRNMINFWGFRESFRFAPRSAYASDKEHPETELRMLVKQLHRNGIELVLQFYFTEDDPDDLISSALRHWVYYYHIDGIHFKGISRAAEIAASDPVLTGLKLWSSDLMESSRSMPVRTDRGCAIYRQDFMYASRRFLRGDDYSVGDFVNALLDHGSQTGCIKYICDYEGFRLSDLVSYEHKHNEANGEGNTDGSDNNISWNCGVEGRTRRNDIMSLRYRQMRNALSMLLLSQGTPMIFGGDEFGNSQEGNNNPYCQDNLTGWVDWKQAEKPSGQMLADFVRFLVKLRTGHRILHEKGAFRLMDYMACGYPDLSFHGTEAWRPDLSGMSHSVGLLFCGLYEKNKSHDFFYIAFNMHWKPVKMALPKLPGQMKWYLAADTSESAGHPKGILLADQDEVTCNARSVVILTGKGKCLLGAKGQK